MLPTGIYQLTHYTLEKTDRLLLETIKGASDGNVSLLIVGDFNLTDLKWSLLDVDIDKYNTLHLTCT